MIKSSCDISTDPKSKNSNIRLRRKEHKTSRSSHSSSHFTHQRCLARQYDSGRISPKKPNIYALCGIHLLPSNHQNYCLSTTQCVGLACDRLFSIHSYSSLPIDFSSCCKTRAWWPDGTDLFSTCICYSRP